MDSAAGSVAQVSANLRIADRLGAWKMRWGIGRMNYRVEPGLYAVGQPDSDSPVLVSANYKLSFDRLRCELDGLNVWILVIDTKGINVWCAAGKGTFGDRRDCSPRPVEPAIGGRQPSHAHRSAAWRTGRGRA